MKVIITEKPSVARDIASVLKVTDKKNGYIEGRGCAITWAFGHLVTLLEPGEYDPEMRNGVSMLSRSFRIPLNLNSSKIPAFRNNLKSLRNCAGKPKKLSAPLTPDVKVNSFSATSSP